MSFAIKVENLSKKYYINEAELNKTDNNDRLSDVLRQFKYGQKRNDVFWALKNINFKVDIGEVVGIIGSNGAGKSTLLKIMSKNYTTNRRKYSF
jgi:lipopolysaccharide transport system ATP-binding protein